MVKDDGEAAKLGETLGVSNPDGGICVQSPDAPDLPVVEDSQIAEDVEMEARVSGDGGDDMSVTLAELSSNRLGKRGSHQDDAKDVSKDEDSGSTDEKIESPSVSASVSGGDDSVILRRSSRKKIDVDFAYLSGKVKKVKDVEKEKDDGEQKPVDDDGDEEDDDDEDSEFSVGDFVWGKVKSHPWWPGRVFDPVDASELALKYKHEGRILVAYFGDATFAWCDESQLKPFVENFAEMSKQSSSKNFLNAVEEAVTEFGWLVEQDMTCYCTPRSEESADAQHQGSAASNAGIKGGVNVNKDGIGMYSFEKFNPAAFLDDLRTVGKRASCDSLLELATLRSKVSAVYRPKNRSMLLKCSEMQEIAAEDEVAGKGTEDTIRGPVEESIQVLSGMPDALVQAKRKERSVAEILYGDEKASENGDVVVEGEKSIKAASKSVRKRSVEDEGVINHQSGKRTKKLEEISKGETETKTVDGDKPKGEKKVGSRSSRMKVKEAPKPIVVEATNLSAFEETEITPRTRDRKKSKYLSPPYTNLEYYRQTAVNSPRAQAVTKAVETSNASHSGETGSKSASAKISNETSKKDAPKEDVVEHGKRNGSVPVTPKRASARKMGGDPTKGGIASSDNVLSGIRSAALSGQLSKEDAVKGFLSSYRSSKYQNESSSGPHEADDQSVLNDEEKSLKKSRTKRERTKLRGKGKAVDLGKDGLEGEVKDEGNKSLKKSEKSKSKNKAKEANSEPDDVEGRKSLKKSEASKHGKAKLKTKEEEFIPGKGVDGTESTQSAALHLKFPEGYPLPSVVDLGALYGKFGALDASKTKVFKKSSSAKLVFMRGSDAEAACKSSKESCPFGEAEVNFRIRYLKAIPEEKEIDENGKMKKATNNSEPQKRKRSTKKQSKASTSDGELKILKQKLEGMATMVDEAGDGKVSSDLKLSLESRLKDLLEEVKALPALPSSSAGGV